MKKINFRMTYVWAAALALALSACSGEADEVLSQIGQETENASRAELVEATVAISEANTLQAALEAAGKANVQKLTLTGELRAVDALYLKKLTGLQELDMNQVTIKSSTHNEDGNNLSISDNEICYSMFQGMTSLTKLVFPNNITSISGEACQSCSGLTEITIPGTVTSIGYNAFWGCTSLKKATIPSSVTDMGSQIFYNNSELTTVDLQANVTAIPDNMFNGCTKLESITLADNINTVEAYAFRDCTSLKDYTPFSHITTINGWNAFENCGFTSLDLSAITAWGSATFQNCTALTSVVLGKEQTSIGGRTFQGCTALTSVKFGDKLEKIWNEAFRDCTALTNITLPSTLKEIGYETFSNTALTSIDIPEGVTTIGNGVFNYTNLTTVTISETVIQVDGFLFNGCKQLNAIFWNSLADVGDRPTWEFNPYCYLYLKTTDGKTAAFGPNWKNVIIDNVAEIVELDGSNNNGTFSFFVPQAFTAKKFIYKRRFDRTYTYPGQSAGWQTIVLPFTPTSYSHAENGVLAPFDSQVEGAKPFWLRELTQEGFADVTEMKPNVPYIIAMPYNPEIYLPEYNIQGEVVFSAEDVEIAKTPDVLPAVEGPAFNLQPTYQWVEKGGTVYALNTNYWVENHNTGSVFVRSTQDIYPFEAYAVNHASRLAILPVDTRSVHTRAASQPNTTGIPAIGDM